ncbi:DNA cytosine methyltransferase [Leeuwenhoekiella sp. H156]|uniref:DNA cytosine methyltransferase n=1 Tax=Leeuwenhoekiella sp. H156 TaxID=3450128 RepID=UPI003FA4CA69
MKKNRLKAVDFFCSAGGVTCGFKQAGIEVLGGIDIDKNCKETYEINNSAKFLNADVSKLDKKQIGKFFKIRRNQRNLIFVGCSPCQYYSNITTNKSKSKKTRLLLEDFREFVEFYRPGYVFIENVPGFDKNPKSPIERFKSFLTDEGYVFDDGILNSKYFGVPQSRRRYVLMATRIKKKISIPNEDRSYVKTVREAIGNSERFPVVDAGNFDTTDFQHTTARLSKVNLQRIRLTKHDGGDRRDWPQGIKPKCYNTHKGHYDVYGRMFWDKPAPTITTRFNSYSNGRYGHPVQDRAISLREGAVLQSFPIDYKFYSSSNVTIAKMIGNAVPPLLAKNVGKIFNS